MRLLSPAASPRSDGLVSTQARMILVITISASRAMNRGSDLRLRRADRTMDYDTLISLVHGAGAPCLLQCPSLRMSPRLPVTRFSENNGRSEHRRRMQGTPATEADPLGWENYEFARARNSS